ncbi:MAG: cytochrome P450 [Rhizobiaceae bacterium]
MTTTPPVSFEPLSPEFARNPYAVYAELRDMDGAYYYESQNMWLLSRYDDVCQVATSDHAVRSLVGIASDRDIAEWQKRANWHDMPYHERVVQFSLLDSDGEIHRRLRRLVFGSFKNDAIAHLHPMVEAYVLGLLDKLEDGQSFDFIEDFAAHVPGYVIGQLLGAPAEDCPQLRLWSEQIVQFFDVDRSDEKRHLAETATREFYNYLIDLKKQKYKSPGNDLTSQMIIDENSGHYTQDEFISTCMLILMAGHGSTIDVLGSGMHILLKHPHLMVELRKSPDKLPVAIQEMFRLEPPLPFFHRHITRDMTVGGQNYPAGTTFGLLYGSANRDPTQFDKADQFVMDRMPNRHLAFGMGAHLCLGNNLARLNMRIVFQLLLARYSRIEGLDADVEYKPGLSVRGPRKLLISCQA